MLVRPLYVMFLSLLWLMPVFAGQALARDNGASGSFADNNKPMALPVDKTPLIIATNKGQQIFAAEFARSDDEKARGLMYRRLFPENRAMVFVFAPEERIVTMWMDNTPLPLDMIFADKQGKIVYIYEHAEPFSHRLISSLHPVSYVIELRAGQAKARGIKAGQKMLHPAICGECG